MEIAVAGVEGEVGCDITGKLKGIFWRKPGVFREVDVEGAQFYVDTSSVHRFTVTAMNYISNEFLSQLGKG